MTTIRDMAKKHCEQAGVTLEVFLRPCRAHRIAHIRQDFAVMACESGKQKSAVARFLGQHPSTVTKLVNAKIKAKRQETSNG